MRRFFSDRSSPRRPNEGHPGSQSGPRPLGSVGQVLDLLAFTGFFAGMFSGGTSRFAPTDPGALLLFDLDPAALLLLDEEAHVLYCNLASEKLFDRPALELRREGVLALIPEPFQDTFRRGLRSSPGSPPFGPALIRILRRGGEPVLVEMHLAAGTGPSSNLRGVVLREVSEAGQAARTEGEPKVRTRDAVRERMDEVL